MDQWIMYCSHDSLSMMLCPPSSATPKVRVSEWFPIPNWILTCQAMSERSQPFTSLTVSRLCSSVTSTCSAMNLRCIKFPMAPESTMAVDLIDSASITGAVRCLMRWYRVITDTTSAFSELSVYVRILSTFNPSTGATGSVDVLVSWLTMSQIRFWFRSADSTTVTCVVALWGHSGHLWPSPHIWSTFPLSCTFLPLFLWETHTYVQSLHHDFQCGLLVGGLCLQVALIRLVGAAALLLQDDHEGPEVFEVVRRLSDHVRLDLWFKASEKGCSSIVVRLELGLQEFHCNNIY